MVKKYWASIFQYFKSILSTQIKLKGLCKPKRNYHFKNIHNFQGVLPFYILFSFILSLIIQSYIY